MVKHACTLAENMHASTYLAMYIIFCIRNEYEMDCVNAEKHLQILELGAHIMPTTL